MSQSQSNQSKLMASFKYHIKKLPFTWGEKYIWCKYSFSLNIPLEELSYFTEFFH